jgi:hypothetical protein
VPPPENRKFVPKNEQPEENSAADEQINENRNRRK